MAAGALAIQPHEERHSGRFVVTMLTAFAVVIVMNLVHEFGHALAGKALGYDVVMRTNHAGPVGGGFRTASDALWMSIAGPLVTLAIAIVAWVRARAGSVLAAMIVFEALAMRVIAAAVSLAYPNDEARISLALGLGKWTLFAAMIATLLALSVSAYRRHRFGWRWFLAAYIGASFGFALMVSGEASFPAITL